MINTFFHIATVGHYQSIVDEILSYAFVGENPYVKHNKLSLCISGPEKLLIPAHPNIQVIDQTDSLNVREFFTLRYVEAYADTKQNDYVGFIHSKGVTSDPNNQAIKDWRALMCYFLIQRWEDCLQALKDGYDVVGVDWREYPVPHFSGAFFALKCSYARKLPRVSELSGPNWASYQNPSKILSPQHNAEFYPGFGQPKVKDLHNSGIDCFERHVHLYPREKYVTH